MPGIGKAGRGRWWWLLAGLAAVAASVMGMAGPRVSHDTEPVARGDVEATVTAIGNLQPRRHVDVGAQVSGQIVRLAVQPGDVVKQGQLLLEIDPSVQQAVVDAGRAAIADLRAQLAEQQAQRLQADQRLARQRELVAQEATSQEDVETAEAAQATAAARVRQLQARIAQHEASQRAEEARLGYTRVFAPMSGTVVSVDAREGQTLNAAYQTPNMMRIADLSAMTVWAKVSEADVRQLRPGLPAHFTTLDAALENPRRWSGVVRQVLPAPVKAPAAGGDSGTAAPASEAVNYTVLFEVDNADGALLPQMTAQVTFVTAKAAGVLTVPLAALRSEDGRSVARVLQADGAVAERPLRLGVRNRHQAEVLEGLAEGERLVTAEHVRERGWAWLQW